MSFNITTVSPPGDMTLETAREIVKLMVSRLPGGEVANSTDNLKRVDYAIKAAGDEFVRRTKCTLGTNDTLTLTANSEDFSTSTLTDFHPSRMTQIEVKHPTTGTIYPAQQVNYLHVRNERLQGIESSAWYPYTNDATQVGTPDKFAWRDADNAIVYPKPGIAWEVLLTYWVPFTGWTIGTASPGGVTLNIPTELIYPVLQHGFRAYFLAAHDPGLAAQEKRLFEKHIFECRGLRTTSRVTIPNTREYM